MVLAYLFFGRNISVSDCFVKIIIQDSKVLRNICGGVAVVCKILELRLLC